MRLFERLLFPIEGSEAAVAAARQTIELARREGSQLILLAVVDNTVRDTLARYPQRSTEAVQQELEDSARRYLKLIAGLAQEANVPVSERLRSGVAHHEVLREARESQSTLIVLGRSAEHELHGLIVSRVVRHIIDESHCPVLVLNSLV